MSRGSGPELTVIAAAVNEASQVPAWLDAVSFADRVVVVDTGSRDDTPELLRAAGAEVVEPPAPGGLVHAAKNLALAEVHSGWVLDLDLDERVPDALREEIRELIAADPLPAAFRIPFRHYVFGRWLRWGGWRGSHLRLSRAGALRYPEDRAHSTPIVEGEVGDLESFIVHFAHPTLHDFLVKLNRYTSQDAPLTVEHGRGGLRGRAPLRPSRVSWLRSPLGVFWNRYVKAAGFRDGVPGFLAAALLATYAFVEQAKVWELAHGVAEPPTESSR